MAGEAAQPGVEPLAFARFLDSSPQPFVYGYGGRSLREMREREFGRLAGTVYLDHAGATLFPQSQLTSFTKDLMENLYGNPHSQNISSKLTYETVEQVRYRRPRSPSLLCFFQDPSALPHLPRGLHCDFHGREHGCS